MISLEKTGKHFVNMLHYVEWLNNYILIQERIICLKELREQHGFRLDYKVIMHCMVI